MNRLAAALGAHDTRAATPSGLDGPGQTTSAYDLALILRSALNDPRFVEIARTPQITFPDTRRYRRPHPPGADTTRAAQFPPPPAPPTAESPPPPPTSVAPYPIFNDNRLLTLFPGAVAGKTGYTDDARKTFVGAVDRGGRRYIVVQLFGLSYEANTYWDQFGRLLDYAVAVGGGSVGSLDPTARDPDPQTTSDTAIAPTPLPDAAAASGSPGTEPERCAAPSG